MKTLYTIGFTAKGAEKFFNLLKDNNVKRLYDIRLNNVSQLAGFTKKNDLIFFLRELGQIEYEHLTSLAPTAEIMDGFKSKKLSWADFEKQYAALLTQRRAIEHLGEYDFGQACLLCSEAEADHCHRRLAAEFIIKSKLANAVKHLYTCRIKKGEGYERKKLDAR